MASIISEIFCCELSDNLTKIRRRRRVIQLVCLAILAAKVVRRSSLEDTVRLLLGSYSTTRETECIMSNTGQTLEAECK